LSTGIISVDIAHMKDGDFAGLGLLQKNYGLVGAKVEGNNKYIVIIDASSGKPIQKDRVGLKQDKVYFRIDCDFSEKKDLSNFFYSLDGKIWKAIGDPVKMTYTIPHFMGYRFALFNYATKQTGGYADFDYFHISGIKSSF